MCTVSGAAGSPLTEIAASPTPNAYSMLNWPGANAPRGAAPSSRRVTTSAISLVDGADADRHGDQPLVDGGGGAHGPVR